MIESEQRESERNAASQGTPEEQIEKYTKKWLELWKMAQIKGRNLDDKTIDIISTPGAMPLERWENYLKNKVKTGNMYEVEAVLQMAEEIAVNGDSHKALEIFDELDVSITDLDRIRQDVLDNLPNIPQQAPDREKRSITRMEFENRANKKAHMERYAITREGDSWLAQGENVSEYEERESERNSASQGTSEEQIEKYTKKWLELWKMAQIKGRNLDDKTIDIISTPGAMPLERWENYLKNKVKTGDMYEVEAVLQMAEEIAVNGDIHKALEIFDELNVSITDLDRIRQDVLDNLPHIPQQAPNREKRSITRMEFENRANEKAHMERSVIKKELKSKDIINVESAISNFITPDTVPENENIGREALNYEVIKREESEQNKNG